MSAVSVVTRFAPSPTGELHLGNARTALFNALLARRGQGRFLLRIEDIDAARSLPQHTAQLQADLRWMGLAYRCFCSARELELARASRQASGLPRGRALFKPLRAALTGRLSGPGLAPLLRAMSDGTARQRLARFA